MNYYPEQLRRIAAMCEALNEIDGALAPDTGGMTLQFRPIIVIDENDTEYGKLADEIGGAWSFFPVT
jgi:hypothetical protein